MIDSVKALFSLVSSALDYHLFSLPFDIRILLKLFNFKGTAFYDAWVFSLRQEKIIVISWHLNLSGFITDDI